MFALPTSPLQMIETLVNYYKRYTDAKDLTATKSLVDATKLARVEPLTVISKDCLTLEYMPEIMQTLLNIFAAYYLQAIAIGARIDSVRVIKILDRLNPDRDSSAMIPTWESIKDLVNISAESYAYRLPTHSNVHALEAEVERIDSGTDANKTLTDATALAVGKLIDVNICTTTTVAANPSDPNSKETKSETKHTIPVNIRLAASVMSNTGIEHILALKTEDNSLVERFHRWRSGRISFINDLILCQDLIDEHRKALMHDESGVYSEIIRRVNNAKKFGLLTKNPSLVSASNLFVISEQVAEQVGQKLGGKLSNPRIRQKAFENTYAMIIAVIDREWERVTFYHRGIAAESSFSIKEIKSASKSKGGPDIADLFRAMSAGQAPTF